MCALLIPGTVWAQSAPTVTTNPTDQTVTAGQSVSFTAATTGNPTPTVQWQLSSNGGATFANIAGATSTTLTFSTVASQNGWQFRAVFTNSQGSSTTNAATLTVTAAPAVTTNPSNQIVSAGATATFTAAASGTPTPTVQWQVSSDSGGSFTNIAGATSTSYTTPATTAADNGKQYRAVFTNGSGTATTTAATLTVNSVSVVTTNPTDQTVTAGQSVSFTAAATGNPTPTVQWQLSSNGGATFANIAGATSTTLTFSTVASQNGWQFRAVFTNSQGSATTNAARLTLTAAPVASSFTYGSIVPYNIGGDPPTLFSVASHVTNSPTSYAVGSATTSGGGTVSIDNAGQVSFTPAVGRRGNDTFTYTATNAGGTSAPATVTVQVGDPTFAFALNGSGTRGAPLSGVQIDISGGKAAYHCGTSVTSGALPAGTSLNDDCTVTGTPTASGSFTFKVTAVDSSTGTGTFTQTSPNLTLVVVVPTLTITTNAPTGAAVGAAYSQTNPASGGVTPYTYALASGSVPAGTALNTATGTVSGTPTTAGAYSYTVKVTDSQATPATATGTLVSGTIAKGNQTTSFTSTAPAAASVGGATYTPTASATSGLPVSLSIDSTSSGVCTKSGAIVSFIGAGTCTINADQPGNPNWNAAQQVQQSFAVAAATQTITFTSTEPAAAQVGGPTYTPTATASSGLAVTFTIDASAIGVCTISGGVVSFTGAGTCVVNANQSGNASYAAALQAQQSFAVGAPTITLAPASLPSAVIGAAYSQSVAASGGTAPYTYAITSGALPAGITLASDGTLSGTPTAGGPFNFTVTATDSTATGGPFTGSRAYSLTVGGPTITVAPASLPSGTVAAAYSQMLSAGGGTAPYSFAITAGALPPGTTLASNGTLAGTPTAGGTFIFTVTATESSGGTGPYSGSRSYSLTIDPPTLTLGPASLPPAAQGIGYSQAISASGGTSAYSYAVTAGTLPSGLTLDPASGLLSGIPANFGSFTFTVTATDSSGGTGPYAGSEAYTLDVTAAAPVAGPVSATVAYGSANNSLTLSLSGGPATSVAVATGPAHGTATATGTSITYTPAAGYFGADSFTYTATGPGGTSAPATVSITVSTPAAPTAANRTGIAVPYNSTGTAIDLSGSITGVHTSIAVATGPAHGTVSVAGDVVTYTPATGYFGADSFTYTATGPGRTSAPAAVSITVATPPAPTAAPVSVNVPYNSAGTAIDLSGSITGVHNSIAVATAPAHGTVSVSGDVVTYTPATGYFGADSFTYAATGPGGTSAPATVSLAVATPAGPTVAPVGANVPYNSSGTAIALQPSGVYTSLAAATAPAHGTVTISGTTATYTPATGYFGNDSFTYTATGPSGTSAPATVSITVATPPAPTVVPVSANVPYNSSGTAIALQPSGEYTSLAVATAPAHGSITISGTTATYIPAVGYFGPDSFTYTATGPGGTSAPATVSITVATPAAPVAAGRSVTVPYQTATAIDLSGTITGVHTSIAVATAPAHGTVSVSGDVVTYTPASGYFGADSFAYTATGPGGTSSPATVTITVSNPPPPQATSLAPPATVRNGPGASVTINLRPLITGVATSIAVATPPQAGTVTLDQSAFTATYTPNGGFSGNDSFTFRAIGPGGPSNVATVSIQVIMAVPTAQPRQVSALAGRPITIDLTDSATGGPFTGGALVSVSPADAADVHLVEGGTAASRTYTIEFTSRGSFSGPVTILYTLTNAGGTSGALSLTVNVEARPDPSADAEVRGLEQAETGAARRTMDTQIRNFGRRLEQLHGDAPSGGFAVSVQPGIPVAGADRQQSAGRYRDPTLLDPSDAPGGYDRAAARGPVLEQEAAYRPVSGTSGADAADAAGGYGATGNSAISAGSRGDRAAEIAVEPRADGSGEAGQRDGGVGISPAGDGRRRNGSVELWANGSVTVGRRDPVTGADEFSITTSGVTGGADVRVADDVTIGAGAGIGRDHTDVGGNGSRLASQSWVAGIYGSFRPARGAFVDVLVGLGGLDFDLTRYVTATGTLAHGDRHGDLLFGSLTAGIDRHTRSLNWSVYGGVEASRAGLDGYTESGPLGYSLIYDSRRLEAVTGLVGGRFELEHPLGRVVLLPRARFEYRYDFENVADQRVRFSDFLTGPSYLIDADGWSRHRLLLELGLGLRVPTGWRFGLDLTGEVSGDSQSAGVRALVSHSF